MPKKNELRAALGAEGQPISPHTFKKMIIEVIEATDTPYTWERIKPLHFIPPSLARAFFAYHRIEALPEM